MYVKCSLAVVEAVGESRSNCKTALKPAKEFQYVAGSNRYTQTNDLQASMLAAGNSFSKEVIIHIPLRLDNIQLLQFAENVHSITCYKRYNPKLLKP